MTGIEAAIKGAAAAAAPPTTGIVAAAGDEVSAAIAGLFGRYAQEFEALSTQTTLFHAEFVRALSAAGAHMRPPRPRMPRRCARCCKRPKV
ncbi:PE family protein [Mycobacterium kansasii 732]|uniref:PE family protein n=1 Tax=Mycobacterium gastri TaxID=1777 RepID=UPI0004473551|nr:PE family protein [Mycobacterium gastri]EUA02342.1 PE family protein [Mycobacterium kansasii 732]